MRVLLMCFAGLAFAVPVLAEEAAVSRQEVEKMNARLERMESALKEQAAVIKKQQETIEKQARKLDEGSKEPASTEAEGDKWYDKIEFAFGATGVLQGSAGAKKSLSPEEDITDGTASFDIEVTAPIAEHGTAYAHVSW